MASTGTQTTWSSNGGFYLKIVWDITSQSVANNTSAVRVRMYLGAKSGWSLSDSTNSWALTFDGSSYSGSNANLNISGSEQLFATYSKIVDHNADGTKSVSFNGSISGLYFGGINPSSFSGTLDTIPRASSSSSSASWLATESLSIGIQRASSSFTHTVRVYVGSTLVGTNTGVTTSTTFDSSTFHNNVVTALGINSSASARYEIDTFSGSTKIGSTFSRTGTVSAPRASTLGSVPNSFNVGSTLNTFSISRENTRLSHKVEMIHNGTVVLTQTRTTSDTTASLGSTSSMYARMTTVNSATVDFRITTYYSDTQNSNTQIRTPVVYKSTAMIRDADPSNPTLSYSISGFTAVTGNTTTAIVQGKTNVSVTFTASSPKFSATISRYNVTANGMEDKNYPSASTYSLGVLNSSGNGTITVEAVDSRGNTGSSSIPITIIPYQPPRLSPTVRRDDGFGEAVTLLIKGTMSFVNVSGARKNFIKASRYRIRELPTAFTDNWVPLSAGTNGDTYTYDTTNGFTRSIPLTLSSTKSYEIEVEVTDAFDSIITTASTRNISLSTGQPLFWLDTNRLSVGVNKFPDKNYAFDVGLEWGDMSLYSNQSVVSNNEVSLEFKTKQDPTGGFKFFTRQDSTGWWDTKDGRTVIRYVPLAGNSNATAWDKGDVILDPFGKVQISANAEALRLRGTDHSFITFFNGSTRQGWMGQGSSASNNIDLRAERGNLVLQASGSIIINSEMSSSTKISGRFSHTNGYLELSSFSSSYGSGQGELWYNATNRIYVFGSRNSGDSSSISANIRVDGAFATAFRATDSNIGYLQTNGTEFRVTQHNSTSIYKPIRASSYPTGSSINYKTNLENIDSRVDALELIKDTDIWHYHLKSNLEGGIYDKPKVGVISEMVNSLIRDEDGVDPYSMVALSWRAIQQLSEENISLKKRISDMEKLMEAMINEESNVQN